LKEVEVSRIELNEIKTRIALLELSAERIDKIEKSILHNEAVLAAKVSKLNAFEKKLDQTASHDHIRIVAKKLSKLGIHEEVLAENALVLKQLYSEIEKLSCTVQQLQEKLSSLTVQGKLLPTNLTGRADTVGNSGSIQGSTASAGHKALAAQVKHLDAKLNDRLSQLEYQNKLIMKYLKKIDEQLF
jgi:hypothetical protein